MAQQKQPRNIFEQILFGQETTNENVIVLGENLKTVNDKLDFVIGILCPQITEPTALGAVNDEDREPQKPQ